MNVTSINWFLEAKNPKDKVWSQLYEDVTMKGFGEKVTEEILDQIQKTYKEVRISCYETTVKRVVSEYL